MRHLPTMPLVSQLCLAACLSTMAACGAATETQSTEPRADVRSKPQPPRHGETGQSSPRSVVLHKEASLNQLHCGLATVLRASRTDRCVVAIGASLLRKSLPISIVVGPMRIDGRVSCDRIAIQELVVRFGTGVVSSFADRGATRVVHASRGKKGFVAGGVGGVPHLRGSAHRLLELVSASPDKRGIVMLAFQFDKAPLCPAPP